MGTGIFVQIGAVGAQAAIVMLSAILQFSLPRSGSRLLNTAQRILLWSSTILGALVVISTGAQLIRYGYRPSDETNHILLVLLVAPIALVLGHFALCRRAARPTSG